MAKNVVRHTIEVGEFDWLPTKYNRKEGKFMSGVQSLLNYKSRIN